MSILYLAVKHEAYTGKSYKQEFKRWCIEDKSRVFSMWVEYDLRLLEIHLPNNLKKSNEIFNFFISDFKIRRLEELKSRLYSC